MSELDSEGIRFEDLPQEYDTELTLGDTGREVLAIQYYLNVIAAFYDTVPRIVINGVYDEATDAAVRAYQAQFGLPTEGVLDRTTWQSMVDTYRSILDTSQLIDGGVQLFPGQTLRQGSQGDDVATIQEYLSYISQTYTQIPTPSVTGVFGQETAAAVTAFQQLFGLNANGAVGPTTWDAIATLYSDLRFGNVKRLGQFPGNTLTEEEGL